MPKAAIFNARIETADTSGAFKDAWKSKRCLIPFSGFYEWTVNQADGKRDPLFIHLPGDHPFSFAGLRAHNELHDRQLAILACDAYDPWLDPATPLSAVKPLLQDNLDGDLEFQRVNRKMSASGRGDKPNDDASMIGPANPL